MIRREQDGVVFYQFETLAEHSDVIHAVFTRLGGWSAGPFSSLNVGQSVGDDETTVRRNHQLVFQTLGLALDQVVTACQVHGTCVAVARKASLGWVFEATDALISQERGVALLLRFADCLPLMLYDPQRGAIGLVHAGWRGCLAGVLSCTIRAMEHTFGCAPADLLACLGPAIGPCCYRVGEEVITRVRDVFGGSDRLLLAQTDGSCHFDLPGAVRLQLLDAGVHHIEASGICTCCRTNEFYSHRAEKGRTGRFATILALR